MQQATAQGCRARRSRFVIISTRRVVAGRDSAGTSMSVGTAVGIIIINWAAKQETDDDNLAFATEL